MQWDKLERRGDKIEEEDVEYQREMKELKEYEEHYKSKLQQFEQELEDIVSLDFYLQDSFDKIDSTAKEKKLSLERSAKLKADKNSLKTKVSN